MIAFSSSAYRARRPRRYGSGWGRLVYRDSDLDGLPGSSVSELSVWGYRTDEAGPWSGGCRHHGTGTLIAGRIPRSLTPVAPAPPRCEAATG